MNVVALAQQAQQIAGQQVTVNGILTLYPDNDARTSYLVEPESPDEQVIQIRIAHSFAELRRIIQPLTSAQLARRGEYIQLPALYALPVCLTATITLDEDNLPILTDITQIEADFAYPEKISERVDGRGYHYQAQVEYGEWHDPQRAKSATARILATKTLSFAGNEETPLLLQAEELRYAPSLAGKPVTLPGTLLYLPGIEEHTYHFVFETLALRTSRIKFGLVPEPAPVWLRPSPLDLVLLAAVERPVSRKPPSQRAEITAEISLLRDETPPVLTINPPKLVVSRLLALTLFSKSYLL